MGFALPERGGWRSGPRPAAGRVPRVAARGARRGRRPRRGEPRPQRRGVDTLSSGSTEEATRAGEPDPSLGGRRLRYGGVGVETRFSGRARARLQV